ncbi:serine/threonine-protein kinase [Streptomyces niveus]|uniref:serine/threonine-protein kinase n=1 Tax=Streptomyces niveus TaxID=193462 RepID=UPI00084BDE17|nr:serine/threonine-protein kinase [Streptomyces niveus]
MTLLVSGDRVSDTLVIDRSLGEGAFAEVHRVRHEYLGWQAMKLFKRVASKEETVRMLDEARLLSTLGHPNIVRVFDANTVRTPEGVRGFFTMEYVAGGSLERLAAAHKSMVPRDLVAEVVTQIASGLAVAHDQDPPIVHRDVTMANVLVGYDGTGMRVRVSDFGLAKRADPFTHLASAQGTYAFMAPEVMRNQGYSCASDVWSVGVIAYLLLTNRFPFHQGGEEFSSFSFGRFNRSLLPPSSYNDEVDAELDRIVLAMLELDPQNRPATAQVLGDALRERAEAMAGAGAGRRPVVRSVVRSGVRRRPRHPPGPRKPPGPRRPPGPRNPPSTGRPRSARGGWPKKHSNWPARRGNSTAQPTSWRRPSTCRRTCATCICPSSRCGAGG